MDASSDFISTLLEKKGIKTKEQREIFLNPTYDRDLHDPFLMQDMTKVCERIHAALKNEEKILIYADYDCDGIPGAVILNDFFKNLGYQNYEVYIPQRNSEGYGLNTEAIRDFGKRGVKLLITIDLGITAVEEVECAKKEGIDVIITDHHLPLLELPKAYAILNPKVDNYPEKMLCGAGVAFKLVQGFIKKYGPEFSWKEGIEKWMLDMAGLATLSDMVPLSGENRAIAYFGLKVLRKSPRPGLQALLRKLNIDQRFLTEDDVTFMITPRLNAASRMDDPRRAYELLSTSDPREAQALALHLSKINDERKIIVSGIMREVTKNFEKRNLEEKELIVVGNPAWRVGVLGLVASKISDEYGKTVFVWGKDERDSIKGSCRSDGSVSVVELMTEARESFVEFGGHELAGGFTVVTEKIHFLEEALANSFVKVKRPKEENVNSHDLKGDLSLVNMKNWQIIEKLGPFGLGNDKPLFVFPNIKIEKIKKFGKNGGEHLELTVSDGGARTKAVSFFSSHDSFGKIIEEGGSADLYATFDLSRFMGREELRLKIVDIL
jgi:single-stranded-DNA-specific exonuclease